MRKSWELFLVAIGLMIIVSSPKFSNPMISIIMGLVFILVGVILYKKSGKND